MSKTMECGRILALVSLLVTVYGRSHFPVRYASESYSERQNSLSANSDDKYGANDIPNWVKVDLKTPRVIRVPRGGKVEFICEASGSPSPSIKWFRGPNEITPFQPFDESNEIKGLGLGKVISRYLIDCAQPMHQGTYTCVAIAGEKFAESLTAGVVVDVDSEVSCKRNGRGRAPKIIVSRPVALENWTNNIVLPCTVRGNPKPKVFWIDEEENVIDSERDTRYKVLSNGDLSISRLRWEDMGRYTCVAENKHGRDTATTFLYPMKNEK